MNLNSNHLAPEPTEAEIQHAAYLLWLESGRVPGRDLDNWLAAKELLRHRHGRSHGLRRHPRAVSPSALSSSSLLSHN